MAEHLGPTIDSITKILSNPLVFLIGAVLIIGAIIAKK